MLRSYLIISIRNLSKRKAFAVINILGLAAGTAVCLVIGTYIAFESSFDSFHSRAKSIFRVVSSLYTDGPKDEFNGQDLGPALADNYPEISSFTRTHHNGSLVSFTAHGKELRFRESKMMFVDTTFLKIFSFRILRGAIDQPLHAINSVIITQSVAQKYFGDTDPLGRVIELHDGWTPGSFAISAVIEDVPENSHMAFDFLLPMQALLATEFYKNDHLRWDNFRTYVVLREDADIAQVSSRFPGFVDRYRGNDKAINPQATLQFQNLLDIHYSPNLNAQGSHLTTLYLFGIIAVFVLSIAWINYINLATARALDRAREVGVKKAIGASRRQLIVQFFLESVLVNFASVALAAGMAVLLLPFLNSVTGRSFELNFTKPELLITLGALFTIGSVASGLYPAVILSSFKTTDVIKGKVASRNQGWPMRNVLAGFQFGCSFILLVGTMLIYRQVNFMQNQEMGFKTDQTVVVKGPELGESKDAEERMQTFKNELLQYAFVAKACTSFSVPGQDPSIRTGIRRLGSQPEDNRVGDISWVDSDFIDLYNIPMISGRTWNGFSDADLNFVVINEEAVDAFQLGDPQAAINQSLILPFDTALIIGVVKNHHWSSLKQPFTPLVLRAERISTANISIRLKGNTHEAMETIKEKYQAAFPDNTFSYYFLDEFYREQYRHEEMFGQLFSLFSALAVAIGCLGLGGLASFVTLYRRKEISIRKTLGASVRGIVALLVRQFMRPLLIGIILVFPLAWIGGRKWLDLFPYRTDLSLDLFTVPLALLLMVSLITVSYQTLRVAYSNPVDSLKSE